MNSVTGGAKLTIKPDHTKNFKSFSINAHINQKCDGVFMLIEINVPSHDQYIKVLGKKFIEEKQLLGVSGRGILVKTDEKKIVNLAKDYFKYITSKTIAANQVKTSVKYNPFKIVGSKITIVGRCQTFVKNNILKESKKLSTLEKLVSELMIKERKDINVKSTIVPVKIADVSPKERLLDIIVGLWTYDFTVEGNTVSFPSKLQGFYGDVFKNTIKAFKKYPIETTNKLAEIMCKIRNVTPIAYSNNEITEVKETIKILKPVCN